MAPAAETTSLRVCWMRRSSVDRRSSVALLSGKPRVDEYKAAVTAIALSPRVVRGEVSAGISTPLTSLPLTKDPHSPPPSASPLPPPWIHFSSAWSAPSRAFQLCSLSAPEKAFASSWLITPSSMVRRSLEEGGKGATTAATAATTTTTTTTTTTPSTTATASLRVRRSTCY